MTNLTVTENKSTGTQPGTHLNQSYYNTTDNDNARCNKMGNDKQPQEMKIMTITPKLAQEILDNRGRNRNIRPTVVNRYAHDMKNGNWFLSSNPISFDQNGELIDGQHRLSAVVQANMPIQFWVASNVPREVPFDIQTPRNTIDNLLFSGLINEDMGNRQYGAIVNAFLKLRTSGPVYNSLSAYEKGKVLNKYSSEIKLSKSISKTGKHSAILNKAPVQASIMTALIVGYAPSKLYEFAEIANSGLPSGDNPNPALILRRMIGDVPMARRQLSSVTEQAIIDFVSGKKRKRNYDINSEPPITINLSYEEVMA